MNEYTRQELANPQTYRDDKELSDFAFSYAGSAQQLFPGVNRYDLARQMQNGEHAARIHKSWTKKLDKWMDANELRGNQLDKAEVVLADLATPAGVAIKVNENNADEIFLTIPRDGGLMTPKIKRLGGWWDVDECQFVLPLSKAGSLPRILKNWETAFNKKSADMTAQKQVQAKREYNERLERLAKLKAERAEREAQWAAERAERKAQTAHARNNRIKITVGQYQVGDEVPHYGQIKTFGSSWSGAEYHVPTWQGSLYEPCQCGSDGPVDVGTFCCERCHPDSEKVVVNYCYAYFV